LKLRRVAGFRSASIAAFARQSLDPACAVISDGLACFAAVKDAGHHVGRRHQSDLVPESGGLTCQVVCPRAGLHSHQTWTQPPEERQNLRPPELPAQNNSPVAIDAMHLKDGPGQIEADGDRLIRGWLPSNGLLRSPSLAHRDAVRWGPSTPSMADKVSLSQIPRVQAPL